MGLRHNVVIFILVIGTTWAANPKSFSIFNVVQFKNEACVSTSTTMGNGNRNGTCFTSEECEEKNGKAEGNCASGFGVCCVFLEKECGAEIDQNCTYIQNEDYPTAVTTAGDCEYKIKKCDDAICTVRLDFEQFNIDSWATTDAEESRICVDSFDVTVAPTTGLTIPSICGTNAGQHMYICCPAFVPQMLGIVKPVVGATVTSKESTQILDSSASVVAQESILNCSKSRRTVQMASSHFLILYSQSPAVVTAVG